MGILKNPVVENVLARLAYEHLLMTNNVEPRKRRISLEDVLETGNVEPRALQVLPAILIYKPKILKDIEKDLKRRPEIIEKANAVFGPSTGQKDFFGTPTIDCQRSALAFKNYLDSLAQKRRRRLFNLRLNETDWRQLENLSKKKGIQNYSKLIRLLLHEAAS